MAAIPGTSQHRNHWYTRCSCGTVISTCGCEGGRRGEGPYRVLRDGCARCKFIRHRPITEEELHQLGRRWQ